ncbi:unnamed protein product [Leptidea sinapis]|uniref:Peptidase C1A papain C-terminal domain-containing protein n=1 Tax=Leptidea sinapis TaxID=189913 RepID=A0A5E4PVZ2_9NEOP|nr:unnamed protein product [Leptidea sinapis]
MKRKKVRRARCDTQPIPVAGFRKVEANEEIMKECVFQYGPLTAAINSASLHKYKGGIDEPTDGQCPPDSVDHHVLIVGYSEYEDPDTGKRTPYWIIKNSWGTNFGDNGYYYLVRGRNACGITTDVSFSFVK